MLCSPSVPAHTSCRHTVIQDSSWQGCTQVKMCLTPAEMGMWLSKLVGDPSGFDKSCTWSLLAGMSSCSKEGAL